MSSLHSRNDPSPTEVPSTQPLPEEIRQHLDTILAGEELFRSGSKQFPVVLRQLLFNFPLKRPSKGHSQQIETMARSPLCLHRNVGLALDTSAGDPRMLQLVGRLEF
jgi:hypothetical protein